MGSGPAGAAHSEEVVVGTRAPRNSGSPVGHLLPASSLLTGLLFPGADGRHLVLLCQQ